MLVGYFVPPVASVTVRLSEPRYVKYAYLTIETTGEYVIPSDVEIKARRNNFTTRALQKGIRYRMSKP